MSPIIVFSRHTHRLKPSWDKPGRLCLGSVYTSAMNSMPVIQQAKKTLDKARKAAQERLAAYHAESDKSLQQQLAALAKVEHKAKQAENALSFLLEP
jgi:hypothetical protein